MALDFVEIEPTFADSFLLEMDYDMVLRQYEAPLVFKMEMGEFDHFEPLWEFLRARGLEDLYYNRDFLIAPEHIRAAVEVLPSLWPQIHRTRAFFHPNDDPFWALRNLFERLATTGAGLLALCD